MPQNFCRHDTPPLAFILSITGLAWRRAYFSRQAGAADEAR